MATISSSDYQLLVEDFNRTRDITTLGHCLHHMFEHATAVYPNNTALICGDEKFTFQQLNERSNRLARVLVQRGTQPKDLVVVAVPRSIELVVALLATLKAGAAYVPVDTTLPAERVNQMLDDASPKLVITASNPPEALTHWAHISIGVCQISESVDASNLGIDSNANDLAYVMYTSGSTGRPKAVEMSHNSTCNCLFSLSEVPGFAEADRLLAVTTVSFDMAVPELFMPLLCGGTTVIAQTDEVRNPASLLGLIRHHSITTMQATPAAWQMLLDSGLSKAHGLVKILSTGEALSRRLADRLSSCADSVWNLYGPTETSYASVWKVSEGGDAILAGEPIKNSQLYILGEDQAPVAPGKAGELYIGGEGVARGYANNAELTNSRFVLNPFHGGTMYRSGDLARFAAPGQLQLLGRIDGQVKIRGYRIELGDIEAAICSHVDFSAAVVVKREDRLIAYCIRNKDASIVTQPPIEKIKDRADAANSILRPWLTQRLPPYMLPAFIMEIDSLPINDRGKVDQSALPDPVGSHLVSSTTSRKPVNELEQHILSVWSEVLGHADFGVDDNFFQIGGDSVRVVRVQLELQKLLGHAVSPAKLFEHFTIRALAADLASEDKLTTNAAESFTSRRSFSGSGNHEDIAVVSLACHLPGGIRTPEDFWELLDRGGDVITDVPKDRWDAKSLYDIDPAAGGKSYCQRGGFIDSVGSFDASFFGMTPREARALDPTQRVLLETCWESFERAGYTRDQLMGSSTGVYIGISNSAANYVGDRGLSEMDGYAVTGSAGGTISGRVSYLFGLEGPALTVDTACSSSLVTTHLACTALRQGECDLAISGGVSLVLTPGLHVEFSRLQGISPDGQCRAFAGDTQGTSWGEGSAAVVLKRLSDAQRDGDIVHAVLRGSAVNHSGKSASLTTPSGPAQQRLIRTALASSGLQPADIDYIEAHGTGTKLGDPIEAAAIAQVFNGSRPETSGPLWVGSAKSNLGHTQAAAGLVGLIKVALSMKYESLPQTLHVAEPTPAVDWQGFHMAPVQKKLAWPVTTGRLRRAGVSAFGIGGTNAHVIVEEPPSRHEQESIPLEKAELQSSELLQSVPVLLSAHNETSLKQQAAKLRRHLASAVGHSVSLGDVANSLATTRNHFKHRAVFLAKDRDDLLNKLSSFPASVTASSTHHTDKGRLAMLFTGQGSQQPGMGKSLAESYPVFQKSLHDVASKFTSELEIPLLDVMWADAGSIEAALLQRTDYAQCALFALEVSLFRLWQSWGVLPQFVLGHSVGELAAAHVAGIMNLTDACRLVAARGRLMQALPDHGRMVSLEGSGYDVTNAIETLKLGNRVGIAGFNGPSQTVASGDGDAVDKLTAHFDSQGRKSKLLEVSQAFHSHHLDGMLADLEAVAATVRFSEPLLPLTIVSSLTGNIITADQLQQTSYWARQARNPVRFLDGIQTVADQGANIFLELGPRPVLCGMGVSCLQDSAKSNTFSWLPSLTGKKPDIMVTQTSLAELHSRHVPIDWPAYFKPFGSHRVELPTYAFQREKVPMKLWSDTFSVQSRNAPELDNNSHGGPVADRLSNFEFDIDWQAATVRGDTSGNGVKTWGLLSSGSDKSWKQGVEDTLSRSAVNLLPISHIADVSSVDVDGLLCLWDSDADILTQTRDFVSAALAQLQQVAEMESSIPLVWVTRSAVGAGAEDRPLGLGAGPLWGLMRTARTEHPDLHLQLIDLDNGTANLESLPSALELHNEPECAIRSGQVLVPQIQRRAETEDTVPTEPLLRTGGALLITGGLGGIGKRVARWAAEHHGVKDIVLVSRRGIETPDAAAVVAELAQHGARATVVAADVSNFDSIRSVMELFDESRRPLRGVIHTAGVLDDGTLAGLTPERCHAPFAPKIDGAWHLHRLTQSADLDLFVMFSSISGIIGNAGQGSYAASNTFLDSLAYSRRAMGLPATSIAWGLWDGAGMGAGIDKISLARLAQIGLDAMSPDDGLELLERAVRSGKPLTVAAAYTPSRLRGMNAPPLLRSLLSRSTEELSSSEEGGADNVVDLRMALRQAPTSQHPGIVLTMVREAVANALGFATPEDLDIDSPLQDIGLDSLTAVFTRNQLTALSGLTLSARIAFDHSNLKALSAFLHSQLVESLEDASPSATTSGSPSGTVSPSGVATPATTVSRSSPLLNMAAVKKGCLDPSLHFANAEPGIPTRPQSVLVTGSTGFVGAFIVHELLAKGITVYCLVRADGDDRAKERVVASLESHGLWLHEYEMLIHAIAGDMSQPWLGLNEDVFNDLANRVDAICHSGALVDWMLPLEDYVGPNIVSTHEILRLAACGLPKAVHLVSTVATLPKHMGLDLTEQDWEYGYGTSKYAAERMIAAARWRGAKASAYRLPFVTAAASTGRFRLDRGDFLHNLIAGSIEMGSFPALDSDLSIILPVDYLAQTVVSVMTDDRARIGHDFDFVNAQAPTFTEYFKLMSAAGAGEDIVSFQSWREQALAYASKDKNSSLARIAAVLDGCTDKSAAEMFVGPRVGENVFGGNDYPLPPVDEGTVQRYLDCIRSI